jgi:hypothetical protein
MEIRRRMADFHGRSDFSVANLTKSDRDIPTNTYLTSKLYGRIVLYCSTHPGVAHTKNATSRRSLELYIQDFPQCCGRKGASISPRLQGR